MEDADDGRDEPMGMCNEAEDSSAGVAVSDEGKWWLVFLYRV